MVLLMTNMVLTRTTSMVVAAVCSSLVALEIWVLTRATWPLVWIFLEVILRLWCKFQVIDIVILMTDGTTEMAKSPAGLDELFKGRHFEREIIVLCVRWYLRYKVSFRDLVEMMAERGLSLAHTTIMRWVQRFAPEFERRWNRFARQAGQSWRVDETYIKIRGVWTYLYRAVDREGRTVDFRLSARRNVVAAKAFFRKALKTQGRPPRVITLDGYAASHRAVREMPDEHEVWKETQLRSSKYLNNMIEQDHRSIKARIGPMLGFKRFRRAKITIAGIELLHRIRKNQFDLSKLSIQTKNAPEMWEAVLAA